MAGCARLIWGERPEYIHATRLFVPRGEKEKLHATQTSRKSLERRGHAPHEKEYTIYYNKDLSPHDGATRTEGLEFHAQRGEKQWRQFRES